MNDENKEVQPYRASQIVNVEDYAMTPEKVIRQVQLIQQVMKEAMADGEHYGVIPGTNKPTLLKAGAEKLCLTFRLDPNYDIIREVRESDFIAYTVKCSLTHIPTGQSIASGIGACNSRETKYRYRNIETPVEPLTAVPKAYWSKRDKQILGGKDYKPWKNPDDGQWYIATFKKIENENPWDLDNTLIKMACKRALVAATLNATAASDIFTQDLEDMPAINGDPAPVTKKEPAKKKAAPPKGVKVSQSDNLDMPTDGPPEVDQSWTAGLNVTNKAKLFHFAGVQRLEETELAALCAAYAANEPFTNEKAKELLDNFKDAVVAFREGAL